MKLRTGFVSNSSSSSFVAVGISRYKNEKVFNQIVKGMMGKESDCIRYKDLESIWINYGICKKDGINLYTSCESPFFVGLDMIPYIKANKTLSEARKKFKALIKKKLKINITLKDIILKVGEVNSG